MCSQPVTSSRPGGPELADELEESGYDAYLPEGSDSESALA